MKNIAARDQTVAAATETGDDQDSRRRGSTRRRFADHWSRLSSHSALRFLIEVSLEQQPLGRSLVAAMRLLLATSAFLIIAVDPTEPNRLVVLTYSVLAAYVVYSGVVYVLSLADGRYGQLFRVTHWIDLGWYTVLVALSNGTHSLFFFGYLFAVLVASFRFGSREGVRTTVVSTLLFAAAAYLAGADGTFELNRTVLRPIYLMVLGYLMASFGHFEVTLRDRLQLLRDVSAVSNPRFGVGYTVQRLLDRVREFYGAHLCLLIMEEDEAGQLKMRRASANGAGDGESVDLPARLRERLMSLPETAMAIIRQDGDGGGAACAIVAHDMQSERAIDLPTAAYEPILATLDAASVATVPVIQHTGAVGRVYVASRHRRYSPGDLDLLMQVFKQMIPVIDNIRLLDRLASDAAERERRRIAHDIHDSVIQSFVSIQLGVAAARQRAAAGQPLTREIEQLDQLIGNEIVEARRYISELQSSPLPATMLRSSLERFVDRFAGTAAMTIHVDVADDVQVTDRLGAELLRIIEEGLSNIRRHTRSSSATVRMTQTTQQLTLQIENGLNGEPHPPVFSPRSITQRARELGGRVTVSQGRHDATIVTVDIPL